MQTSSTHHNANTLVFTDAAAQKVHSLIVEENHLSLHLRVYIQGGGCSGMQYVFTFDDKIKAGDHVVEKEIANSESQLVPVKLVVDSRSFQYLKSATIDYREDINGAQFIVRNPNAKTTCGCGSSFST